MVIYLSLHCDSMYIYISSIESNYKTLDVLSNELSDSLDIPSGPYMLQNYRFIEMRNSGSVINNYLEKLGRFMCLCRQEDFDKYLCLKHELKSCFKFTKFIDSNNIEYIFKNELIVYLESNGMRFTCNIKKNEIPIYYNSGVLRTAFLTGKNSLFSSINNTATKEGSEKLKLEILNLKVSNNNINIRRENILYIQKTC